MWPGDALPQHGNVNWQVFYATGDASNRWQSYMKPPGASMIYILMIAAGAGGSRPPDGSATIGGGGGGSGGHSRLLVPAFLLPDIIYVSAGKGGIGATTANTIGGSGNSCFVSIAPTGAASSTILTQGPGQPGATVQGAGSGGASGTSANAFTSLGLFFTVGGQNGTAGSASANANASSVTIGTSTVITSGGSGGGNGTGSGGNISGSGFFPTFNQSSRGTGADGVNGLQNGLIVGPGLKSFPFIFSGGTGGNGVTTAVTAGKGGDAAYGGGGGGGAGGTNAGSISGNGGNGGDGLIIIGAF